MVFVYFLLAAAITVYAAIKLSLYADVMTEKSKMGGMLVGTVLLAGATSLPEAVAVFMALNFVMSTWHSVRFLVRISSICS